MKFLYWFSQIDHSKNIKKHNRPNENAFNDFIRFLNTCISESEKIKKMEKSEIVNEIRKIVFRVLNPDKR